MTDRLDLPSRYRDQVEALLREHVPGVAVWAYGSRVNGESHDASDLDLVLRGPDLERIPSGQLADLNEALEESNVPIIVQVHDWARLPESFHREIEQAYVVLVEEKELVMVSEWVQTSLADLIDIKHGFAFKGAFIREEECDDVLLTPGNFAIGGGFKDDKFKYYYGLIPEEFVLSSGDLLVTMTDLSKQADTLGYPAIVPTCSEGRRYLHNQRLGKVLIKDKQSLIARYLYYVLCSAEYRHEVLASATGTTVKHTSPDRIKQFRFLLPLLSEQRAIAHILGTLDDKIELNRRMNETLEEMARALFKSWFVDFDPVRAKMEGRDPGLPKHLADLFPDRLVDSELGLIPEGWEVSEIGKEVDVVGGSTPSTKEPAFWEEGNIQWATPKDLSRIQSPVLIETERKITSAGLQKISSGLLPVGTVLLSSRAPVGYLAIAQVPLAVNQGFIAMKCSERISKEYTLSWCYENMDIIKANAGGTTFQEISKRNFRPIKVIVPTTGILKEYDSIINPLFKKITLHVHESQTLAAQRDALLPKLVSGKLRMGDMASL